MRADQVQQKTPAVAPSAAVRYYGLDALRAIMMLLGLVLHAVVSYMHVSIGDVWPFRDPSTHGAWTRLLLFIHVFRMPIFYVMAGFFAALLLERRGTVSMVRNRTTRILVPFVIGWIILVPLVGWGFDFANAAKGATLAKAWNTVSAAPLLKEYIDSTIHLWFLYYLTMFYAVSLVLDALVRRSPASWRQAWQRPFGRLLRSRWRPVWFAIPTAGALALTPAGLLHTSTSFVPDPLTFVTYGIFFGFGWLLYLKRELLSTFDRDAWLQVALALALTPINLAMAERSLFKQPDPYGVALGIAAITGALIVWLFTFGLTGLFQRHLNRPSPAIRYIVDASYWVYLIHLPFTIWIPGVLVNLPWPSTIKIIALLVLATPIWWASYDLFVRNTFIGVLLNGRRYRRGLPDLKQRPTEGRDAGLPDRTVMDELTPTARPAVVPRVVREDRET